MSISTTIIIVAVTVLVSVLCFNNAGLFYGLSLNPYAMTKRGQWYRLITHGFVHGSFMHLFVNAFVLWSFGSYVESFLSAISHRPNLWFMVLYFGGMAISAIPDIVKFRNYPQYNSIGASGAVSAVLFASVTADPWGKILLMGVIPMPSIIFAICYLLYENYLGKRGGDNVNHKAHIWGALFGFALPFIINPQIGKIFFRVLLHPVF